MKTKRFYIFITVMTLMLLCGGVNGQEFCFRDKNYVGVTYMFAFSPDSKTLIYPAFHGELVFKELLTNKKPGVLKVTDDELDGLVVSKKGKWLVTASTADSIYVYEFKSKKLIRQFYQRKQKWWGCGNFSGLDISDDEKYLAYKYETGVRVMNLNTGAVVDSIHYNEVFGLDFSEDGKLVIVGLTDSICVYDRISKQTKKFAHAGHMEANCARMCKASQYLVSLGFEGGDGLQVRDMKSGKIRFGIEPVGHMGDCNTFAINQQVTQIAFYQIDPDPYRNIDEENSHQWFVIWCDLKTGKELGRVDISADIEMASEINYVGFSPDGKYLGFCGADYLGLIRIK